MSFLNDPEVQEKYDSAEVRAYGFLKPYAEKIRITAWALIAFNAVSAFASFMQLSPLWAALFVLNVVAFFFLLVSSRGDPTKPE